MYRKSSTKCTRPINLIPNKIEPYFGNGGGKEIEEKEPKGKKINEAEIKIIISEDGKRRFGPGNASLVSREGPAGWAGLGFWRLLDRRFFNTKIDMDSIFSRESLTTRLDKDLFLLCREMF